MRFLLLHRSTLSELLTTLLLSSIGFTTVISLVLAFQLLRKDLPGAYIEQFLPCLVPPILLITLSLGCLFATTLTFSRQASDLEIQAAQWSGVSLSTCAAPALLLGAGVSLACVVLNDRVIPAANARLQDLKEEAAREMPLLLEAMSQPVFATPTQKIYIHAVDGERFVGVTVMETANSLTTRILNAREARVRYERDARSMEFDLRGGSLDIFDAGPPPRVTDQAEFDRYPLRIAFDTEIDVWRDWKASKNDEIRQALRRRLTGEGVDRGDPTYDAGPYQLYLGGLDGDRASHVVLFENLPEEGRARAFRASMAQLGIDLGRRVLEVRMPQGREQSLQDLVDRKVLSETPFASRTIELPLDAGGLALEGGLDPSTEQVRAVLAKRVQEAQRYWYQAKVELQERMSTAIAPLCFTAVGIPLGIWLRHGNRLVSFGASLLVVFALYVPALVAGKELSLSGRIPAAVGLWAPDVLMLLAGALLFRRIRY